MTAWPKVRLGDVLHQTNAKVEVSAEAEYPNFGILSYGRGVFPKPPIAGSTTRAKALFRARAGQFVYSRLFAFEGAYGVVPRDFDGFYVSNEFPLFDCAPERILPEFLARYLSVPPVWASIAESAVGVGHRRQRVQPEHLLTHEIPLPPLAEQQRVVARIEEVAAQIHEARSLRAQAADEADALWERGASEILDRAVESWPLRSLADLVTTRGGGTPSKSDPFYWDGDIPWISPKDMKRRELHDAIDHISERATRETAAKLIAPGAVLVVVRGMILAHTFPSAVLRAPAAINQDMKALIPCDEVLPEFLCSLFWAHNSRILELVEKSTHDTRKLETPKLLDTKIAVPLLAEQRCIVAELAALQAEVDALKRLQSETAAELDALLPAILHRAFKGELT